MAAEPASAGPPSAAAPSAVDLRPVFEKWKLPPRAQGNRGTCSVFAVVGAIEFALAERQRRGERLSVEFLNWASNEAIHENEDGACFADLWKGFEAHGICPEADMPYRPTFDPKQPPDQRALDRAKRIGQSGLRLHWIKRWDSSKGLSDAEFDEVKKTLRGGWPVCAGLLWPKAEQWKDGILQMAPREGVRDGHSILLVGFRDDAAQPGGGVFLMHNSGKGDREGQMTYEYARAYTNDAVWFELGDKKEKAGGEADQH